MNSISFGFYLILFTDTSTSTDFIVLIIIIIKCYKVRSPFKNTISSLKINAKKTTLKKA